MIYFGVGGGKDGGKFPKGFSDVKEHGAPGWLSRLSTDSGSGRDLAVLGFKPRVGLRADSLEPGTCFGFCVSLSLSLSAPPLLEQTFLINFNLINKRGLATRVVRDA